MIYLIGSLKNPAIVNYARLLEAETGETVFDDWYAPGPNADDCWKQWAQDRGWTYEQALQTHAARHIFEFDLRFLKEASQVVLICPAGRSAHMELGWALGQGKPGHVLLEDETQRWDVMYQFATTVTRDLQYLLKQVKRYSVQGGENNHGIA